ncbi:hypothetical protein TELCIR_12454 [Teladorsagia circumcincta]|uniref:Calcineurin-like phosphoesterase domain-containing protein n=1 Tax=Teladorsagia circumcincta TaxID=45464 RepID=A0A2G9U6R3_TELCI|nr:hypothetical protein TELCIR_12454 [Teladorsagia circumcincta]
MPVAAIIADTIYCAHGGISPFIDKLSDINKIKRPSVVPAYGIGCDLVWSDPALHRDGWVLSHREFFQMYKNGYRISFDGRLVTLFSAPNYMNYKNNSCVLTVTKKKKMAKEKKVKKDVDKKSSESEQELTETIESGKKSPTVESHSTKAVRKRTPKARTPKEQPIDMLDERVLEPTIVGFK